MRYPILLLSFALAACATTGSGNGTVSIETANNGQPLPGANCSVRSGAGNWDVITPATVPVGSPSGDLRVVCNKSGFRTSEVVYRPSSPVNSNIGIGAASGGRVGVGIGLGFPIGFGGGGYPTKITVDMNPQ
ncbi:MAG: hypothetical protein A3I66_01665 [Burkholderiales bacterium RIFCSPLOWO2_02_FULL_57_36]|nr:MAG: hypothetical protein A3I66_01665 [Burkholderiales bacterium RIFCSPLOWO2_02_FULL_57_36]